MKYFYRYGWYFAYVYWFVRRCRVLGSCVIVEKDGHVLLVRQTYGHRSYWFFPGGGRKNNENPKRAAERELKEEVGLSLELQYLGDVSGRMDWRHITDSYYLGKASNLAIEHDRNEIEEYLWWPKDALPDKLSPLSKAAADKFLVNT